jgi:PPK2 family polyphosphate:nucleotide phosphotransferase
MLSELRVEPGRGGHLADRPTADRFGLPGKRVAAAALAELHARLFDGQARLWAEDRRSLLLVLQGMDAGGKDGTIRSVFSGLNPQGVRVVSFKVPAGQELQHDYLWRVHAQCPRRGEIGIFNRSHYEDIVAVRVHGLAPADQWKRRYRHIREFERILADEGTTIVKVFLHISSDEQRRRLQARLTTPEKNWKFRAADLDDRKRWDDFQLAYEEVLSETSTAWAPWYVVAGDRKWARNVAVASLLVEALADLDPQYPPPEPGLDKLTVI